MLEVGCGSGQHAAFLCGGLGDGVSWLPTDVTDDGFGCVLAHSEGVPGVRSPVLLDASLGVVGSCGWGLAGASFDVVVSINMVRVWYVHVCECVWL